MILNNKFKINNKKNYPIILFLMNLQKLNCEGESSTTAVIFLMFFVIFFTRNLNDLIPDQKFYDH